MLESCEKLSAWVVLQHVFLSSNNNSDHSVGEGSPAAYFSLQARRQDL